MTPGRSSVTIFVAQTVRGDYGNAVRTPVTVPDGGSQLHHGVCVLNLLSTLCVWNRVFLRSSIIRVTRTTCFTFRKSAFLNSRTQIVSTNGDHFYFPLAVWKKFLVYTKTILCIEKIQFLSLQYNISCII